MRCQYIPIIMDKNWKKINTECRWGCEATGTLIHCWLECKMMQPLFEIGFEEFSYKTEHSANTWSISGVPRLIWKHDCINICMWMCLTVYNLQNFELTKISLHRWIDKETGVHMLRDIFSIKKWVVTLGKKKKKNRLLINNASLKRQCTIWIQLYVIQENTKV